MRCAGQENWKSFESQHENISVLRFVADLSQTPIDLLRACDDLADITNLIRSEESRINSKEDLCQLVAI